MKKSARWRPQINGILLIVLVAILQPYCVLITEFGPSAQCLDCSIINQTALPALLYLVLPLSAVYLLGLRTRIPGYWLFLFIALGFALLSFRFITIPLFRDRIAAWSTFSEDEIWLVAILSAAPALILLSTIFFLLLVRINRNPNKNTTLLH